MSHTLLLPQVILFSRYVILLSTNSCHYQQDSSYYHIPHAIINTIHAIINKIYTIINYPILLLTIWRYYQPTQAIINYPILLLTIWRYFQPTQAIIIKSYVIMACNQTTPSSFTQCPYTIFCPLATYNYFFPAEHTYFRNAAVTASDETIKKHNQTSESVNSVLACSWLQRKTTLDWNHTCSCWKVFCVPTYIRLQQAVGLWQKRIDVQLKFWNWISSFQRLLDTS